MGGTKIIYQREPLQNGVMPWAVEIDGLTLRLRKQAFAFRIYSEAFPRLSSNWYTIKDATISDITTVIATSLRILANSTENREDVRHVVRAEDVAKIRSEIYENFFA